MSAKVESEEKRSKYGKRSLELNLIEAALYVAGRPLEAKALISILKTSSKRRVRRLARALVQEYSRRDGALELVECSDGRYVLQLKPEFVSRVRTLATRPLLTLGPLKTLSYIAYNQPLTQSSLVKVRGRHVYRHVRDLESRGLVSSEKSGRSKMLRTTRVFADYFDLSSKHQLMRQQLEALFEGRLEKLGREPIKET